MLTPRGHHLFAVPIGREFANFNAQRVFPPPEIRLRLSSLMLQEASAVDDVGIYHEGTDLDGATALEYGCLLFHPTKP